MPAWRAVGLGVAAGVVIGLGGGGLAVLAIGVVLAVLVVAARRPAVTAVAAGLASAIAALGASEANDGSWKTFAGALLYGVAVAAAVVVVSIMIRRFGRPSSRLGRGLAALVVAGGALGATALPSPGIEMNGTGDRAALEAGLPRRTLTLMDRFIRQELSRRHLPGVAVAVVTKDRALLERGYGVASTARRPMTAETPQIVASLSKSMTAVAVATLVEEGRVSYDAPVRTYLPWFRVADPAASRIITVRQLLNQSSGLASSSAWGTLARTSGRSLEDEVRAFRTVPLAFAPGHGFAYSNRNYQAAGLIVETVSGEPFGAYLEEHVLRPAHMTSSFAADYTPGKVAPASGYRGWFGVPVAMKQPFSHPATPSGSVYSTAHDLGLYLQSHLGKADLAAVLPATYAELHRPVRGYGMGWFVYAGELDHAGHAPGATSGLVARPAAGWGIAVIVNQQELGDVTADQVVNGLRRIMTKSTMPAVHTYSRVHVLLGLVAAVLLALFLRALTTLHRWRLPQRRRAVVGRIGWLALSGIALPAVMLAVTATSGAGDGGWRTGLVYVPDFALLWVGTAVGAVAVAVLRAGTLMTSWRRREAPAGHQPSVNT